MTVPKLREHDQAVLDWLRAQTLVASAQNRLGDARTPPPAAGQTLPATPYAIVYPTGSSPFDGPVGDPRADAHPATQITCVGVDRNEAQGLADSIRSLLLATRTIPITGRNLLGRPELEVSRPVQRDDDRQPPLYYAIDMYRLHTTPA